MNDLSRLCLELKDGDTLTLLENHTYHVRQDDSFVLSGYYCSNTASKDENPDGTRYTALYFKDKKNITIDGNGATIMVHGIMTPILLDGCENVIIRNLAIDYARPTMSEMTIVSGENGVYRLVVNEECLYEIKDETLWWKGEDDLQGNPYWTWKYKGETTYSVYHNATTGNWRFCPRVPKQDKWPAVPTFRHICEIEKNLLEVELEDSKVTLPVGCVIQTRDIVRNQVGSFFVKCKNLTLSNVRVKFMHGLGLLAQYCENVTYDHVDCMPKAGRTAASTADFFHFSGCRGDVLIEHCRASGAHDDFINAHGTYLRVVSENREERSIVVRFMHSQSWGFDAFFSGDRILFTEGKTLQPICEGTVSSVTRLNDTDIQLVLTDELPAFSVGEDAVENLTWRPNLIVRNNFFGTSSGRGVLPQSAGTALIEDNTFSHFTGSVVGCGHDCNFWYESGRPEHVIFRRNRVIHCGEHPSGVVVPLLRTRPKVLDQSFCDPIYPKITLENNEFLDPPSPEGYQMEISYVGHFNLKDNSFDAPYSICQKHVDTLIAQDNRKIADDTYE